MAFGNLSQLFGVSMLLASATFNHEYRVIVCTMHNNYVKVSDTDAE